MKLFLTISTMFAVATAFTPSGPFATRSRFSTARPATIAVIGASGLLSSECVFQCLKAGDTVIGLTRNPSNVLIPAGSGGVDAGKPITNVGGDYKIIGGDVTNADTVNKLFSENKIDGCIVSLGGKTKDVGDTMLQVGTANVVNAMKANDVKRLAVVSSIGVGDSEGQVRMLAIGRSERAVTPHTC